jgi:hypothetical protein
MFDLNVGPVHLEHPVRADFKAHPAPGALLRVELQGNDIAEVNKSIHALLLQKNA